MRPARYPPPLGIVGGGAEPTHALGVHHAVNRLLRVEQVVHERFRSLLLGAQVLPDPTKDAPAQPSTRRRRGTVVGWRRRHRSWLMGS